MNDDGGPPRHARFSWDPQGGPGQKTPGEITDELREAADQLDRLRHRIPGLARAAHDVGLSWADIGRLLGMTRQSARMRFGAGRPPREDTTDV